MIDPILERALNLFTAAEWRNMVWLLACTLAITHLLKVLWRLSPIKGGGDASVQILAIVSGFLAAYMLWPPASGPWYVAGVIAGPASSVAFKFVFAALNKFSPGFASAINFDRRKEDLGAPPDGVPRRNGDKQP